MLSILIPTYNWDVTNLTESILHQCEELNLVYEIIIVDDKSNLSYRLKNKDLEKNKSVRYVELDERVSRAKIRNTLAAMAQYSTLLFIDCDAEIIHNDFVAKYLKNQNDIVFGGIAYSTQKPAKNQRLRWKYGKKREMSPAETRMKKPYMFFSAFNVLIPKELFSKIQFNEQFETYGYEDTYFGYQLQKNRLAIKHINNELQHNGLCTNSEFVAKIEESIQGLISLLHSPEIEQDFFETVKLYRMFRFCQSLHLVKCIAFLHKIFGKFLRYIVIQTNSLRLLDLYKIGFFCHHFSRYDK
ncbi:MAG: glycosyltransferase family 2 protein [Bacteroidales bacterium]|nr:glycosyltransferase family 2 protein [Bacteroidales bacterium]